MSNLFDTTMEIMRSIQLYEELENSIIKLTGCNFNTLRDLFAKGYTLTPPSEVSLASLEDIVNEGSYKEKYEILKQEFISLLKRYRHLLESDFIASFDAWNQKTNNYNRDISEADDIIESLEELYERAKGV